MIQNGSILIPADNCGVWTVNTFHLYSGFSSSFAYFGDFIKISVSNTNPENWLVRNSKRKAIVVSTVNEFSLSDSTYINYNYNAAVVLNKRLTPEGNEVFGPISSNLNIKKFLPSFSGLI